jgi:hypothetical protein
MAGLGTGVPVAATGITRGTLVLHGVREVRRGPLLGGVRHLARVRGGHDAGGGGLQARECEDRAHARRSRERRGSAVYTLAKTL